MPKREAPEGASLPLAGLQCIFRTRRYPRTGVRGARLIKKFPDDLAKLIRVCWV